jgi:hypothetical protein
MGRGHVGNLVMELAGLDITESLKFLVTGDKQIPCAAPSPTSACATA